MHVGGFNIVLCTQTTTFLLDWVRNSLAAMGNKESNWSGLAICKTRNKSYSHIVAEGISSLGWPDCSFLKENITIWLHETTEEPSDAILIPTNFNLDSSIIQ